MEPAEPFEAWICEKLGRLTPASCLAVSRRWRSAALQGVTDLKLFSTTLEKALALIAARPHLLRLDVSKCKALHDDDALAKLSSLLRGLRSSGKVRPFLRPGEGLRHLYFGAARGPTATSCRCLQRLGLQWWAFHAQPSRGSILVSRPLFPSAGQPELIRSVILVLEHSKSGSKGIILTQHSKLELELDLGWDLLQIPVRFGGSCGKSLLLLHSSQELQGEEVAKGVFLSSDEVLAHARDLLRWKHLSPEDLCCFFGCCHWEPGELEAAIEAGYFASAFCDPAFLVSTDLSSDLWHDLSALLW